MFVRIVNAVALSALFFFYIPFMFLYSTTYGMAFNFHPVAMIAMFGLMSMSIQLFASTTQKQVKLRKDLAGGKHRYLVTAAEFAAFIGACSILYSKFSNGYGHFTTWHSIVGALAAFYLFTQSFVGYTAHFNAKTISPALKQFKITITQMWRYHKWSGLFCYSCAFAAVLLGFESNWMDKQISAWSKTHGYSHGHLYWANVGLISFIYCMTVISSVNS